MIYVGECAGSCSVGRLLKRWIDTIKGCLKKRGLDIRQARRMVRDKSLWQGFESMGDEPLILTRWHSYMMKPLKGGSPSVAKPLNLRA